jgi:phenylalanyl-tRNA synthetase beta chain
MRISQDWLNEFVTTPALDKLEHTFEMAGIGVESTEGGIFELEVTNNRGDWLSAIGLAREIAALTDKRLRLTTTEVEETSSGAVLSVDIESSRDCPRYFARVIENLKVGPSPDWMQRRLTECGVRSVNNIVDVTNYVMLETGQPLHAFDADKVANNNIVVRRAFDGEKLHTLDDIERVLTPEVLVIADPDKAIGIAGVMGGLHSEVTSSTTRVLLESAHFDGLRVRRGARALGLSSEASRRFERWVDPNGVRRAADRAAHLLQEHAGGTITSVFADRYLQPITPVTVRLRSARCNAVLGLRLTTEAISKVVGASWLKRPYRGRRSTRCHGSHLPPRYLARDRLDRRGGARSRLRANSDHLTQNSKRNGRALVIQAPRRARQECLAALRPH